MFFGRENEIAYLNGLGGAPHFLLLSGRRRVGKSELLLEWAKRRGEPYLYWAAVKETPAQQRARLAGRLYENAPAAAPVTASWDELLQTCAHILLRSCRALILDNFPCVIEADNNALPAIRKAWEDHWRPAGLTVILCGSPRRAMQALLDEKSPLADAVTANLEIHPLPFGALQGFFPAWDTGRRLEAWAMTGGVPAYLSWLDAELTLAGNLQQVCLNPANAFLPEAALLLYDDLREHCAYLGILKAIAGGAHTLNEISARTGIPVTSATFYLGVLQELRLVERCLPLIPAGNGKRGGRSGRYTICDPFMHFYLRFIEPRFAKGPPHSVNTAVDFQQRLSEFIAGSAFPALAGEWLRIQADARRLPFTPEAYGSCWNDRVNIDLAAVNRSTRDLLLCECKWRADPVDLLEVRALTEAKTRWVLEDLPAGGAGWRVHYAVFSRKGFLPAAYAHLRNLGGQAVNLAMMDRLFSEYI